MNMKKLLLTGVICTLGLGFITPTFHAYNENMTPTENLFQASKSGNIHDIYLSTRDNDSIINSTINEQGFTPLTLAVENNQIEAVKYLVKIGADINATDDSGMTALMIAAKYNYTKMVEFLINENTNINNALYIAGANQHQEMVDLLLGYGEK